MICSNAEAERDQLLEQVQLQKAVLSSVKANKAAVAKALRQMRDFHAHREKQASLSEVQVVANSFCKSGL